MDSFTNWDIQTKVLHVGYSVLGMLVGMVILVKFKPPLVPRLIVATLLGFVLVYCLTATGDPAFVGNITSCGWFTLGLIFGIGRGEFIIEYIAIKFLGATPASADEKTPAALEDGADQLNKESLLPAGTPGGGDSDTPDSLETSKPVEPISEPRAEPPK